MPDLWRRRLDSAPLDPPHDPGGPVLVVSAHPDDEVIAIGAWLAGQSDREIVFVTATDGEASHPDSPTITPDELRRRRPVELVDALTELGLGDAPIHRLGLPDGGLQASRRELCERLAPFVDAADLVLAPFEGDGHPDHDAVGAVAVDLCGTDTTLWRFPLWTWVWTRPGQQEWVPAMRRLPTSSVGRHRKRRALARFRTQVRPLSDHPADESVVDHALLGHARLAAEVVLV